MEAAVGPLVEARRLLAASRRIVQEFVASEEARRSYWRYKKDTVAA